MSWPAESTSTVGRIFCWSAGSGTGKTHLATALGFAACQQGRRVRFFTATGLVTQLLERREERQMERLMGQLERQHLIVLGRAGIRALQQSGGGALV